MQRACKQQANGSIEFGHVPRHHVLRCSEIIPLHETVNNRTDHPPNAANQLMREFESKFPFTSSLQALNIAWTSLEEDAVSEFSNHITENLLRLNISGCRKTIKDEDLIKIVHRCPNLRELDLSDCTMLTSKTIDIVSDLQHLEYLSLSRCYNINVAAYL